MNCHSQIWTNAQLLEPVRASYRTGQSLQWTRVNQLPDFVFFNHSIHINKGVGCNTCHGPVDQMPLMYQQESLQMEWCLSCHRAPEQNLRPRDQVFNMRYQQPTSANPVVVDGQSYTDQIDLGTALAEEVQRAQRERHYELQHVSPMRTSMRTCHPERRSCFAKRSNFGVEGPRYCWQIHRRFREFSHALEQYRQNALPHSRRYPRRRGPSTARDFASRTFAPLRMTVFNRVMCNQ